MRDGDADTHMLTRLAEFWGRTLAVYSRWATGSAEIVAEGALPPGPFVAVTWHSMNMLTLAVHARGRHEPYRAFVPPGFLGASMRGWLVASGMEPVALAQDGVVNPIAGLRQMARALSEGWSVGIALDGPHGPRRVLRPGALWLARLSGKPLVVMGYAAKPAFRAPRWDRHLVPLPGARIAVVYGDPLIIGKRTEIDDTLTQQISNAVDAAERRAWALLADRPNAGKSESGTAAAAGGDGIVDVDTGDVS
jgi:lysophospholipid acyltransferase (LPLAT)-like uncharacterized protein